MKKIDSLVEDIRAVLKDGVDTIPEDVSAEFQKSVKMLLERFVKENRKNEFVLRMSNYGQPERQLWFNKHFPSKNKFEPEMYLKFLVGDITEAVLLALAKLAGHDVSEQQSEVELEGIKGHLDAVIDGVVVDAKSASGWAFKNKFKNGQLKENDTYGYIPQVSGYNKAKNKDNGAAFLVYDKESSNICLLPIEQKDLIDPIERIKHIKQVLDMPEPPEEKCYKLFKNKSGDWQLTAPCGWCPHKLRCYPKMKALRYASGDVFLPDGDRLVGAYKVEDVTNEYKTKEIDNG